MTDLQYKQGGNPPHSPGIYRGRKLVALWPAWIAATQERVDNICRLIGAGRQFQSREEIEAELMEAGLLSSAQAMSASDQDPQGLGAKPASAVPQGCAQTPPESPHHDQ